MKQVRSILLEAFTQDLCEVDMDLDWQGGKNFYLNEFAGFCCKHLGIPKLPPIRIVATREGGMTTGAYDPATHQILVYGKGRALVDILRTLAHELTHYRQRLQDKIKSTKRDWNLEGEADGEAGKMVFNFAHSTPTNMKIYEL